MILVNGLLIFLTALCFHAAYIFVALALPLLLKIYCDSISAKRQSVYALRMFCGKRESISYSITSTHQNNNTNTYICIYICLG